MRVLQIVINKQKHEMKVLLEPNVEICIKSNKTLKNKNIIYKALKYCLKA